MTPHVSHTEEGSGFLLEQFRDSEIIGALVGAALKQLDILEAEILRMREAMSLENAPRSMLELVAKIVGQECTGFDTEALRLWIRARIAVNRSRGTIEDLFQLVRILVGTEIPLAIVEYPEIAFTILVEGALVHRPQNVLDIINEAKPLGVSAYLQYATQDPIFRFDSPAHMGGFFTEIIGGRAS